jgi:hypothetical protein
MAKDAGGHGSESRGGSGNNPQYDRMQAFVGKGKNGGGGSAFTREAPARGVGVNQIGQESATSRELRLYADNNADLNRQSTQPIRDNLGKKMDKGVYDSEKATKLWGYHADRAAQAYTKEFGSPGDKWHQQFSPADRREAAAHWEHDERGDIKSGSSRTYKGK